MLTVGIVGFFGCRRMLRDAARFSGINWDQTGRDGSKLSKDAEGFSMLHRTTRTRIGGGGGGKRGGGEGDERKLKRKVSQWVH